MDADAQKAAVKSASRRYGEVTHIRFSADELANLPIASEALRPAILDMTDQLRRVGINFNQAVRAMDDGRVAQDEDLEQALIAVGDLVRQFREELKAMAGGSRKAREAKP